MWERQQDGTELDDSWSSQYLMPYGDRYLARRRPGTGVSVIPLPEEEQDRPARQVLRATRNHGRF